MEQTPEHKHVHKQTKAVVNRLSRVEGHVRSIKKMVEEGRDCFAVLKQVAALRGAVRSLGSVIVGDHLRGCVAKALSDEDGDAALIDQVVEVFNKFSK